MIGTGGHPQTPGNPDLSGLHPLFFILLGWSACVRIARGWACGPQG